MRETAQQRRKMRSYWVSAISELDLGNEKKKTQKALPVSCHDLLLSSSNVCLSFVPISEYSAGYNHVYRFSTVSSLITFWSHKKALRCFAVTKKVNISHSKIVLTFFSRASTKATEKQANGIRPTRRLKIMWGSRAESFKTLTPSPPAFRANSPSELIKSRLTTASHHEQTETLAFRKMLFLSWESQAALQWQRAA